MAGSCYTTAALVRSEESLMANAANISGPTLTPTAVGNGVGLPALQKALPWQDQFSDQTIKGAFKINPAMAPAYIDLKYASQSPLPNALPKPLEVKNKVLAQTWATEGGHNAWKKQTLPAMSNQVLWNNAKPQKPVKVPWNKVFIPPLALFNDASQWVNRLMFNQPMQKSGSGNSMPNLMAQYFTPPPILTNNFAAGTLNAQLQLGTIAIQAQQLTISASNYFGGS
jgi:hypothetical protein